MAAMSSSGRSTRPTGVSPAAAVWALGYLVLIAVLFLIREDFVRWSYTGMGQFITLFGGVALVQTIAAAPQRMWSPSSVLFLIFFLFHCGLAVVLSFSTVPEDAYDLKYWFSRRETRSALWLVMVGVTSYAAGVGLARAFRMQRSTAPTPPGVPDLDNNAVAALGAALVVFAVSLWFLNALVTGGPGLLVGSYREFLDAANNNVILVAYYTVNAGVVLVAATSKTRWHRPAWIAFGLFALVGFPLGLRGEVLFPLATAAAIASSRGFRMRTGRAIVLIVLLLAGISMARQMRQVGVGSLSFREISGHPQDALIELGTSLHPVQQVVLWHDRGEAFAHGATYWAPVDRFIYYFIPGWTRPPIDLDERMMSVVIAERAGPIGFSIVAEAYHNFASEGVVVILLVVGFLFGRIDLRSPSRRHQIWVGTLLLAVLSHVRNPFVGVPVTLLVGLVFNSAAFVLGRIVAHEHASRAPSSRGMSRRSPPE